MNGDLRSQLQKKQAVQAKPQIQPAPKKKAANVPIGAPRNEEEEAAQLARALAASTVAVVE